MSRLTPRQRIAARRACETLAAYPMPVFALPCCCWACAHRGGSWTHGMRRSIGTQTELTGPVRELMPEDYFLRADDSEEEAELAGIPNVPVINGEIPNAPVAVEEKPPPARVERIDLMARPAGSTGAFHSPGSRPTNQAPKPRWRGVNIRTVFNYRDRAAAVGLIFGEAGSSDTLEDLEREELSRRNQTDEAAAPWRNPYGATRTGCWNCGEIGHSYNECPMVPDRQFCYRCGTPDVTFKTCPRKHYRGN